MDIKNILSDNIGINELTGSSLKEAIANHYLPLPDHEKRCINRAIAHYVMKTCGCKKGCEITTKKGSLSDINVLAINHIGPLDVTIEWKTEPNGSLQMTGCRVDSGGDQINVSKVFHHFNENIALVALTGKKDGEITGEWERNFLNNNIIATLIRNPKEDELAGIYNIIDGTPLTGMFGWAEELSKELVEKINQKTLTILGSMLEKRSKNIWMVLSSGGPLKYNKNLSYYASLIKRVKEKYQDRVKILIDFKFMAGSEETMSVLEIHRDTPQDIIKPNLEEFIQILMLTGLVRTDSLNENTITEEDIKKYALKLRNKYNLLGVLVSMDRSGLMLVMKDRIIKEKGIKITQASPTGAGDSLKAGFLYALSKVKSFEEAVHTGNLFGASTASMEGTQTVTPEVLARTEALAEEQNVKPVVEQL